MNIVKKERDRRIEIMGENQRVKERDWEREREKARHLEKRIV